MANNNKKRSEGFTAAQRLINEMVASRTVGTDYNRSSSQKTSGNVATTQSSPEAYVTKRLSQLGLDRKEVNDDFVSSFINDSSRYANEGASLNSRIGVGTSSSIYNSRKETAEDLRSRSWAISRYLEQNKESIPEEYYASLRSYLDNFDQYVSQSLYSTYSADKFYSQFDSEETYNKWLKYSTPERRQEQYEQNMARLEELKQERAAANNMPGMNPYLTGAGPNTMPMYGAALQNQQAGSVNRDIDREIAQIEKEILLYERGGTDDTGFYYGFKIADDYGELRENEDFGALSANRGFQNASREDLIKADALNDSSNWYYDANGVYRDAYGNALETDASGNWVNPNAQGYAVTDRLGLYLSASEEELQEAIGTPISMEGTWESVIKDGYDGNWELLTKDEIDIYYYLLNSSGQETADKYLADMKVELNRRNTQNATALYTEAFDEANALERLAMSIATTPAQLFSGAAGFIENTAMAMMGKDINPYSAAHSGMNFSNTVRSEQAQAFDEATGGIAIPFINFTAGDLYQAGMSAFDMAVGGRLGAGAYEILMGMGSASSEAKRLYEQGATQGQIAWGGALAGAAEMVFEHVSIENLINLKDADTVGQLVKNILIQGGIEASEEGVTEIANTITNAIVMGDDSDWAKLLVENNGNYLAALIAKAQEVGSAAFSGFVSGGFGGSTASVASYAQTQAENKEIGRYISGANSTDALVALAQEMASGASERDQKRLTSQSDRLGKNFRTEGGKNRATGRLYNTVRSVVTEQNISEISTALQEKGFSKKDAVAIAGAVAVQTNGMELSDNQQKVLQKFESNETVQNVLNEVLGNEESGINQRARSISKFEFGAMRNHITSQMEKALAGQENVQASDKLDTEEENGAESSYEVSADGKTILKSTGEIVSVQEVADTTDGKMILRLDNGSTVNAEDVSFGSAGEALVYETVAQMGTSVKAANILVNQFKATDGMAAEVFAQGIKEAFRYGKLGIPASKLASSTFASKLNAGQQEYVYRQGQKAAGKQVAKEQATVSKKATVTKNATTGKDNRSYKATLEEGISVSSLNESQKASYKLADQIAEAAKVNIRVYAGKTGEHGYYDYKTDEIYLNLNATNKSRKSMMAFTLGHELVHRAKNGSPAKYKAFANFLMEQYGKQGSDIEAMIGEELAAAKRFKIQMTYEQAFEEVVCDACERMLLDTNAGQKLAEFGAQSKQNKSFLEDLKRWITEFMDKLRSIFAGVEPNSIAAQEFAKFDESVKQILADMYVDMTIDAGNNLSTIQNAFGNGTVVETNEHGEFTMASSQDGSKKAFNLVTWENGGRETLEATLLREGYTEDEVKAALTIMDEKRRLVQNIANELNDNGKLAFPEQGRINEATLTTDLKDGHSVLSALVSNGDYPVNIDLLMVCKKRKAYQRVINRLCETGMIQQATVDALAIAEINKILGKYGFETACLGCFVESRRLRIQEWAQTICKEWNAEVKKRNPNAKAFGFGKGEATLTPEEVMKIIGELESGGPKNDKGNLNLGQGSAVKRMGVLLDKVPSLRRTLSIEDLITPDGLSSLRSFDSNLFSMVKSRYGSNSPKFVQEFNPYNHELAMYGKVPSEYKSLREYLYAIGGARMQSFSDFIVENWFDYCQIVADLAARKLPMHTYTKEISLAKLFGLTGIKINMSLIPDIDRSLGKEFAGLTRNAKGELELIWADKDRFKKTGGKSYMQSINFADAIALQNDPRYSANIGTIAVGVSDKHILMMLDDARIRMVIPYHSSGMNPIFADLMGTSYYKDYTDFQNTKVKQLYNSKGQPVSLKLEKAQNDKLVSGFHFNAVLQELGDARSAAEAYKDWCADASKHTITIKGETYTAELTPKFDDFSWHENYYKLLEDFNTYDCISEEAAPQGDVQQIYPEDFDDILKAELKAQEGHRQKQETNQAFDKAMGEIESYLKNHTRADTVHYAQQHGIKLSKKDSKLDAADKAKLKKLQENGASFSLPKSEPAPTFYSYMARVVDGVKQEKLGAASVVNMLRGKGVKAEEIKWSGIEAFLEGKKSVTKAELQEFIAGSMLQIEEDMLTDKEIPYSQEHLEQIAKFEAERDIIAENLKSEWKRIVGTDIPIAYFGAGLESAVVQNLLLANNEKKGNTEAGYQYKAKRAALQRVIEDSDHYFGFDNARQAFREALRDPKDFMNSFEMTSFEESVFKDFIKAKEAYSKVEGIPMQDQKALKSIAESADRFSNRINKVKTEHRTEAAKYLTKYRSYTIKGGSNYRELLFRMPEATYSNSAMSVHWERPGVLAHARIQDLNTFLGKMLFIEEIQSDWHNEGHKSGYKSDDVLKKAEAARKAYRELKQKLRNDKDVLLNDITDFYQSVGYDTPAEAAEYTLQWKPSMRGIYRSMHQKLNMPSELMDRIDDYQSGLDKMHDLGREEFALKNQYESGVPDAPFHDNYHEFVLKRLLRMAAEQDYDSIGWTTADIQSDRWSDEYAEGYRIEYDQDIPKFLNKYGKKWGTRVGKTTLDNGTEVWSMAITDEMKDSVLYEGQVLYSLPKVEAIKPSEEQIESNIQAVAEMSSVHDVDEGKLEKSGKKLMEIFEEQFAEWGYNIHSDVFGDIAAKNSSIRSELRHGFTPVKIASIEAIPSVINSGKIVDWIEKNNGTLFRIVVAAPIKIGKTPYIMGVMLQRDNQHQRLYLHDVVVEKEASDFSQDDLVSTGSSEKSENLFMTSILQKILNVKQQNKVHKLPVGEDTSPRALLANALESAAQNDIERKRLQEYKEKIGLINSEEKKLRSLNKQIQKENDPKKVRELQFEANQTSNRINTYDRQLLRLEASKPLQDVLTREKKMAYDRGVQKGKDALEAYRARAEKEQKETIERYQESRKRGVENRQKTAMRQKIRGVIRDLDKLLNRGNKKRNVKEDLKDFVADALASAEVLFTDSYTNEDMVRNGVGTDLTPEEAKLMNEARAIMEEIANLPTGYEGWLARQDQEYKLKGRLNYRMGKLKDVFIRERARLNKTQVSEVLGNLADSYAKLQNSEYAHVQGAYHESVHEYLKMLQEDVGGTVIKDMTLGQLEELYKAYTMVKTTVYNANRMFADNLNTTRDALANRVMFEVHEAGGEHGLWSKAGDKLNSFSWNNEKPVYAFERIGSNTLKTLYGNIRKGQDGWAINLQEANNFRMEMYKKYKHDDWDTLKTYKFTSSSGIEFALNLDQIMSLYAYSKRAQAHDHLLKGGFVFDGNTEVVVNKKGLKITYLNKDATAYNLSFEILEQIINKLTAEQKSFVDEMQEYLSTTMGEKGNEVSMELYGVKLFNEKFYFPLRSAGQYMERAKEADLKKEQGQINIANSGFSKAIKIHASNPVVLSGFMDVWAGHVNEMSMYHSFVLPMEDFRRVYNYSSPHMEGQQSASVNGVIQNAYGAAATDYIDKLYRDLNGGAITDNTTGPINKLMNLFKKGAVFASASVVVQQPSAIARAAALVDVKHFIGPKVDAKRHKALWAEVKKYAPVAIIKEMGFFDTNMGRSATDFLTAEEYSGIKEKAQALVKDESYRDELLSKAPALADELTWCVIWEAIKRETKARNPKMDVKSEEFLKLAGERFSEVIDKTQVYDSVLARSANMRSKDTGMKMATAFMAEPTTSINMVADALRKGKKGNKKYARRAIGSVVASVILNSFLVSFVYAARDDDEDESYAEKYLSAFVSGIVDGVNPATYIPFLKDIVSIVQGYDVERSDMAVISDLWSAWQKLGRDDVSAWMKVEGFVGSICQIFGLPVKNIMRDVRSLYQVYDTMVNGEDTTMAGIKYAIQGAITGKTVSNPDQLYEARLTGDEEHAARVEARYDDEDSANAAVRQAIKEQFMAGEIDSWNATRQMVLYAGMDASEAHWLMDAWEYRKAVGTDEGYSKYNDFFEAVQTGRNLKAVIKEYTDNGVKKDTLASMITSHYKPEYIKMSASERANIKGYLLNALEQCGVDREDAEERLADWDFEAKYGFSYSNRKEAYLDGEVSVSELRTALITVGGYTEEDADLQIEAYDWEAEGYDGVTLAAVREYNEHCVAENVPKDVYLYIRSFSNNTENDVDEVTGKTIYYSAMKKVIAEIDAQTELTPAQKTAIARCLGWSEKNINKYKTW